MRDGYKQTEVGVIPEDWDVAVLGEFTDKVGSGITPTGGSRVYRDSGRPFIRSQNVGWGTLKLDDLAYIDEETHQSFVASEITEKDVLLNITGASIGRSSIADIRIAGGNVNQHVCIVRTNQNQINSTFLNFLLLSKDGQKQIDSFQAGGNREGLNFGQIRSFKIRKPGRIEEQRAIAQALSEVDALIAALDKLIAKKCHLKTATMQQILTGKKRLPGFGEGQGYKQTEVGIIPEDWEVERLLNLTQPAKPISYGIVQTGQQIPNGIKCVRVLDIVNGKIAVDNLITTSHKISDAYKRTVLLQGDLVIALRGKIGELAVI